MMRRGGLPESFNVLVKEMRELRTQVEPGKLGGLKNWGGGGA